MTLVVGLLFASLVGAEPVLVDRIVASVDARVITRSMVDEQMRLGAPSRAVARDVLIDDVLVENACERLRIAVTPAEVDAAMGRVAETNHLTLEELTTSLAAQGYDLEGYRRAIRKQLLEMRWVMTQAPSSAMTSEELSAWAAPELRRLLADARQQAAIHLRAGEP